MNETRFRQGTAKEKMQQGSGMGPQGQGASLQEGHWQEVGGCGAERAVLLPQRGPG